MSYADAFVVPALWECPGRVMTFGLKCFSPVGLVHRAKSPMKAVSKKEYELNIS